MSTLEDLKKTVDSIKATLAEFESKRDEEIEKFQKTCKHERFVAEDDGDCHSRGWYYTCQNCAYMTRFRPCKAVVSFR